MPSSSLTMPFITPSHSAAMVKLSMPMPVMLPRRCGSLRVPQNTVSTVNGLPLGR